MANMQPSQRTGWPVLWLLMAAGIGGGTVQAFDICMPKAYFREIELGIPKFGTLDLQMDVCGHWNTTDRSVRTNFYDTMQELFQLGQRSFLPSTTRPKLYLRARGDERLEYNVTWSGYHPEAAAESLALVCLSAPWSGSVQPNETVDFNFGFTCQKFDDENHNKLFVVYQIRILSPTSQVTMVKFQLFFQFLCNDTRNINKPCTIAPTPAAQVYLSSQNLHRTELLAITVVLALLVFATAVGFLYFELFVRKRWMAKALKDISPEPAVGDEAQSVASAPFEGFQVRQQDVVLGREIGKGAFGVVYEGYLHDERVAVKTLKCGDETSDEQVCRFLEEAYVMAQFQHPNILNLLGICLSDEITPQIIVPFMENGDLHSYLREFDPAFQPGAMPLRFERLFDFAVQIALGMNYLGRRNFVHRDLAARNCMLNSDMIVKVGDFGLGRDIQNEAYYKVSTEFMLPVKWMALESLQFYKFTTQSDVWSYGIVLWELMSLGQVPYVGVANHEILEHLKAGNRLNQPKNCPDKMYNLMLNCWSADAGYRPLFSQILSTLRLIEPANYEVMLEKPAYLNHRPEVVDVVSLTSDPAGFLGRNVMKGSDSAVGSPESTPMSDMPPARHFPTLAPANSSTAATGFRVQPEYCQPEVDEAARTF